MTFLNKFRLSFSAKGSIVSAEEHSNLLNGLVKRFSLHELQVATDNFSDRNILGIDVFGGTFYKGRLVNGTLVAVKRLKEERTDGGELAFLKELELIGVALHRNILQLLGCCSTATERLLVYPYINMTNGSVAFHLREHPESNPVLGWWRRKRIALGAARGLAYLHDDCTCTIIHRDVKAAKIMLDKEFEVVIGDFGLAIFMDHNDAHFTTAVRGTVTHIAPEYLSTGRCSQKTDVFGYGMLLLELITGQRSSELAQLANDEDAMLLDWVKELLKVKMFKRLVDANLQGNYVDEEVEQLTQVALLCTQHTSAERPKMSEVVRMLQGDDFTVLPSNLFLPS